MNEGEKHPKMRMRQLLFVIATVVMTLTFDLAQCEDATTTTQAPAVTTVASAVSGTNDPSAVTDSNPCDQTPPICEHGAECSVNSSTSLGYTCTCKVPWMGENCTQKHFCHESPCSNSGNCSLTASGYNCDCTEDYTGETCDTRIDRCTPIPCEHEGTCDNIAGDYNCTCPTGYGGKNCSIDTDLCDPEPCTNNGNCTQNGTDFSCACPTAYTGKTCNEEVNFCSSGPCLYNGTCNHHTGGYNCTCVTGFDGDLCQTNIDDCVAVTCAHDGTCVDAVNSYSCTCTAGWQGQHCLSDIDECSAPPGGSPVCDVNADCTDTEGSYTCACKPSYTGDGKTCGFMSSCDSSPCFHGYCYSNLTGFECICTEGWSGDLCQQDVDECDAASAVKNNCDAVFGACHNTNGSYTCSCTGGARGDGLTCVGNILYPYENLAADSQDDETIEGYILGGLAYYGTIYWDIYINVNGYMTLGEPYDKENPWKTSDNPANLNMIAPYWTDLDLSVNSGKLYYDSYDISQSENSTKDIFDMVKADALRYNSSLGFNDFSPTAVVVATWHRVAPFPAAQYKSQNVTFQCVLATDSQRSFVMFNYDRDRMHLDPTSNNWTVKSLMVYRAENEGTSYFTVVNLPIDQYLPDTGSNQGSDDLGRYVYKLGEPVTNNDIPCVRWYLGEDDDLIKANASLAEPCPCTGKQASLDQRYTKDSDQCYKPRFTGDVWNICCYDSEMALLPNPGGSHLVYKTDTQTDYDRCCTDAQLCHLYHMKRPADTCKDYMPPAWAAAWGDPHFQTLDGKPYTFNGHGEYFLMKTEDSSYTMQGRTGLAHDVDNNPINTTVFTAFASQEVNKSLLEVRLEPTNKDDISIRVNGEKVSTLIGLTETKSYNGLYISKLTDMSLHIQHSNMIGLTVGLANKQLWIRVTAPQSMKGQVKGLFGIFDGNMDNDLTDRVGTVVLPPTANEDQIYQYGQTWMVQKDESLFTYTYDGEDKKYEDFNFPDFMPMQLSVLLANLSLVDGINADLANTTCGNNMPCLMDYIATKNIEQANWTRLQSERNEKFGQDLSNMPPVFATSLPASQDVTAGQMLTLTLVATDPEIQTVTFKVISNIKNTEYTLEGNVFEWVPSDNLGMNDQTAFFKFYAVDSFGNAALYWPVLDFCGCHHSADCLKATRNLEYVYNAERFYSGTCVCRGGWTGDMCGSSRDPCDPSPCFGDVTCTAAPDNDNGYQCGLCPSGMLGDDGIKCYDNNECVMMEKPCTQICNNTRGGYTCSCRKGYLLQDDQVTCTDVDECTGGVDVSSHTCTAMGEYCINTPGSYVCACKSQYYRENDKCVNAPKRFGGQIRFEMIRDGNKVVTFDPEMTDNDSDMFKDTAHIIEDTVKKPYELKYPTTFKKVQVYEIRNGSTVAIFDLFFDDTAKVNGSDLDDTLHTYLSDQHCVTEGPDCTVGPLVGVVMADTGAHDKDLCLTSRDNDCDDQSTQCTSGGGQFLCLCRDGYKRWLDYTNICQDRDECTEGSDNCNNITSTCDNTQGTYKCSCRHGYTQLNGSCVDACEPNPCEHGGECMPEENSHTCNCNGIWEGPMCTDKNEEAIRMRNIAIAVGVVIGAICLILFILLIICCIRNRPTTEDKYHSSGGTDNWANSGTVPVRTHMKAEYEMRENGSGDSLMDDNTHRRPVPSRAAPSMPDLEDEVNLDTTQQTSRPSSTSGFGSGNQGVQNPAYSNSGEGKGVQANVGGEYF